MIIKRLKSEAPEKDSEEGAGSHMRLGAAARFREEGWPPPVRHPGLKRAGVAAGEICFADGLGAGLHSVVSSGVMRLSERGFKSA